MIINPVEVTHVDGLIKIQSLVEFSGTKQYLWYLLDNRYECYLTTQKSDAFLVALLPLAMRLGEPIIIKGAVSTKLYHHLTHFYMAILENVLPALKKTDIRPASLDDGSAYQLAKAVVTGFSAGVDSFCTIYDHLIDQPPEKYQITHFVFNNVGSHAARGQVAQGREVFHSRYDRIRGFPDSIGIPCMAIDSNLGDLLQSGFQQTHALRNVSAILLLQRLFAKYYYASTYRYQDCFIGKTYDIAYADPMAIHLLSTETLECIATGSQHSRVEKTARLALIEGAERWLNVCVDSPPNGTNCSTCWKCCRTLLTLEMLGLLDKFAPAFDLAKWHAVRTKYLIKMIGNTHDPFVREIREYAASIGYTFGRWQAGASRLANLLAPLYRHGRFLAQKFSGGRRD